MKEVDDVMMKKTRNLKLALDGYNNSETKLLTMMSSDERKLTVQMHNVKLSLRDFNFALRENNFANVF